MGLSLQYTYYTNHGFLILANFNTKNNNNNNGSYKNNKGIMTIQHTWVFQFCFANIVEPTNPPQTTHIKTI